MTMAIEAARACLSTGACSPTGIGFLATASSSYPYDGKFHPPMIAEALGLSADAQAMQFGASTKAGTEALMASFQWATACAAGYRPSQRDAVALAAVGDAPRADVSSDEDHPLGAGAAAFLVGAAPHHLIARFEGASFYSTETMGNWFRPAGSPHVRDIGVPGYSEGLFTNVVAGAVRGLLERLGRSPADYSYVVFQQPDGEIPRKLARVLGFGEKQIAKGLVATHAGDAGAASALLGLAAVLDVATPGERVLVASFGAGSGADAMSLEITGDIERLKRPRPVWDFVASGRKLTYIHYLKLRGRL